MNKRSLICDCGFGTVESHLEQYFEHIRGHERNKEGFKCPSQLCLRRFHRKSVLQSHMKNYCFKMKESATSHPVSQYIALVRNSNSEYSERSPEQCHLALTVSSESPNNSETSSQIFDKVVQLLVDFNTRSGLPMKSLQTFTSKLVSTLKEILPSDEVAVGSIFEEISTKILSLYQISKSFKINNDFTEPTKLQVYGKSGFYCSIKHTVEVMLKCPQIRDEIDRDFEQEPRKNGNMYSFKDGTKCNERNLKMIRLVLFFDDFDLHANQKRLYNDSVLICFLVIENLGRKFISSASRLPLVLILRRSQCSNECELKFFVSRLIQDLNDLNHEGIQIDDQTYHCELIAICGDSKAKAEILSYSAVFSSGAVCLMCNIQKRQLSLVKYYGHFSKESRLKNDDQRLKKLTQISSSPTKKDQTTLRNTLGVTGMPILHGIDGVTFSDLYTPDIFHDCIHGVLSFHLPLYLECFLGLERSDITLKEVDTKLEEFNQRMKDFKGWTELNTLKIERKKKTKSALNIYSKKGFWFLDLFRHLLEILDHEILKDTRSRNVLSCYLRLMKIFSLMCSPVVSEIAAEELHGLIIGYKKVFRRLFPLYQDKPKDHFWEHYSYLLKRFGNITMYSAFPYERAIWYQKRMKGENCLWKHVDKTIASKSSKAFFLSMKRYQERKVDIGEIVSVTQIANYAMTETKRILGTKGRITVTKRMKKDGMLFKSGGCYMIDFESETRFFLNLLFTLVPDSMLIGERIDIVGEHDQRFSYKIKFTGALTIVDPSRVKDGITYHSFTRDSLQLITKYFSIS